MTREMYERSYGYKYHETECGNPACDQHRKRPEWESAADIAKRIRTDIKQAVSEGLLRREATYSVTSESYTGGQSINVTVKDWTDAWELCDGTDPESGAGCRNHWCAAKNDSPHASPHYRLNDEARAAKMTLDRIHGAYNYDGSEIQVDYFDVRYYGHVEFEDAERARWRAEEKARKAAKRAALDAAEETKRIKVYKRDGSSTVHLAGKADGRWRLMCGAQLWRSSLTGETEAEITCSRCQKRDAS